MGEEKEKVFLREATGLVREASTLDILALASINMSWGLSAMWYFLWGPYLAPGGNLTIGILITLIPMIFGALVWAFMAIIMPRSGGDYIFNSRTIHPLAGFLSSFGWVVVNFIWCGVLTAYIIDPALTTLFAMMGWEKAAEVISSFWGILLLGTLFIVFETIVHILGLRAYLIVQLITFAFGVLMFILVWALLIPVSREGFIAAWNSFSAQYGGGTYDEIISAAKSYMQSEYGLTIQPSWRATVSLMPIAFWGLGYPYFAAFIAGETKRVHRAALIGIPMGLILCGISWLITGWLLEAKAGYEFLVCVIYAAVDGLPVYGNIPFEPLFFALPTILTKNAVIIFLIGFGYFCWNLLYPILSLMGQTRIALAWSFDRLAPEFFGDVSEKYHTPVKSTIFFAIGGWIVLLLYAIKPAMFASFTAMIPQILTTFLFTAIAAIIIPYRKKTKELYNASPASKYKIGNIPLVTLSGIIYLGLLLTVVYFYFTNPGLGAWHLPSFLVILGIYIFAIIYFFAMREYRKKQGIDIDLAFKELPPE